MFAEQKGALYPSRNPWISICKAAHLGLLRDCNLTLPRMLMAPARPWKVEWRTLDVVISFRAISKLENLKLFHHTMFWGGTAILRIIIVVFLRLQFVSRTKWVSKKTTCCIVLWSKLTSGIWCQVWICTIARQSKLEWERLPCSWQWQWKITSNVPEVEGDRNFEELFMADQMEFTAV